MKLKKYLIDNYYIDKTWNIGIYSDSFVRISLKVWNLNGLYLMVAKLKENLQIISSTFIYHIMSLSSIFLV